MGLEMEIWREANCGGYGAGLREFTLPITWDYDGHPASSYRKLSDRACNVSPGLNLSEVLRMTQNRKDSPFIVPHGRALVSIS
jgi:hypothetical protein